MSGLPRVAHAGSRPRSTRANWRTPDRDRMWLVRTNPLISPCASFHRLSDDTHLTIILAEIFRLPYETFVDASPGQILYRALGMGTIPSGAHKARFSTEHAAGSYVRHGAVSGLAMVVAHALRVGMPVWERGGDASQLGGEFVLGPGYVHFHTPPLLYI